MPLSEYEQRVLDQLERDLGSDPKLGRTLTRQPRSRGRLVLGVFGVIAGLAVLVAGVAAKSELLGVVGFAVMAGAVLYTILAPQKDAAAKAADTSSAKGGPSAKPGRGADKPLMDRLEERFERRRREGDL